MFSFERSVILPASRQTVWDWHQRPAALERVTPPWEKVWPVAMDSPLAVGSRAVLEMKLGPLKRRWVAEHDRVEPPELFRDQQISGPFRHWQHTHRFSEPSPETVRLSDEIEYRLPLHPFSALAADWIEGRLERLFAYRHEVLRQDCLRMTTGEWPERRLRVALTGGSGLVGRALVALLRSAGHEVFTLRRTRSDDPGSLYWNAPRREIDWKESAPLDAVIHLAGENIFGRWTRRKKERIEKSRTDGTRFLAECVAALDPRPEVFISASGINYYGTGAEDPFTENNAAGEGFLSRVCRGWEEVTRPVSKVGIRTLRLRTGVVLTPAGGALAMMLPAFRAGAGGPVGSGRQRLSWIALDDHLDLFMRALADGGLEGAVNAVAPEPVPFGQFARSLGRVLRRPACLPVPGFALRGLFGREMANEVLLGDLPVVPEKLLQRGHRYRYPDLEEALRHLLGRSPAYRGQEAAHGE